MKITKKHVAEKIINYLKHKITIEALVDWAENAMMDTQFEEQEAEEITDVISRLGLADVKAFGLLWEDCEEMMAKLGYKVNINISEAV